MPRAPGSQVMLIGHNLTPTSYTLRRHELTVGTYALGYGVNENWTIATSPWLLLQYNMPSITTRIGGSLGAGLPRLTLEASYFKTIPMLLNWYQQESLFLRLTTSFEVSPAYTLHVATGYQYFFDETRPFSLRLTPGVPTSQTLSLSALNEIRLGERLGLFLEVGSLGLNYAYPYVHFGASLFWRGNHGLIQAGASRTWAFAAPDDIRIRNHVLHPEIQIQVYL